jgi:hypothetical protein
MHKGGTRWDFLQYLAGVWWCVAACISLFHPRASRYLRYENPYATCHIRSFVPFAPSSSIPSISSLHRLLFPVKCCLLQPSHLSIRPPLSSYLSPTHLQPTLYPSPTHLQPTIYPSPTHHLTHPHPPPVHAPNTTQTLTTHLPSPARNPFVHAPPRSTTIADMATATLPTKAQPVHHPCLTLHPRCRTLTRHAEHMSRTSMGQDRVERPSRPSQWSDDGDSAIDSAALGVPGPSLPVRGRMAGADGAVGPGWLFEYESCEYTGL